MEGLAATSSPAGAGPPSVTIEGVSGVSANATIDGVGPVSETAATMDGSMATLSPTLTIEGALPSSASSVSMDDARTSAEPNAVMMRITLAMRMNDQPRMPSRNLILPPASLLAACRETYHFSD